ncbi:MAG: type II toxin-antitoxin system HicA family toxin [Chloroflexi bacterium]|nr:type II toxin-antitoxin system HicA family toxin [Chloroflexota bacterium]
MPGPFVHPEESGRVNVKHPSKEVPIGTLRNIYRQANWKWEDR